MLAADLASLSPQDRRALERMLLFVDDFPPEAFAALSGASEGLLERGVLRRSGAARLSIEPELRALLVASPPRNDDDDVIAHAEWLVGRITELQARSDFSPALLETLSPFVADVRVTVSIVAPLAPRLAAAAWCAIGDLLFYRRLLPFDVPDYDDAVASADASLDVGLRLRARLLAGRAALELPAVDRAAQVFEEALRLADVHGERELEGDAMRGLGWTALARGDIDEANARFDGARAVHDEVGSARGVADACMAQATVRCIRGDREEADKLLFRAEALLRARQDTVRLGKLGDLRVTLSLARPTLAPADARTRANEHLERAQYWRAALVLGRVDDEVCREEARILADLARVPASTFEHLLGSPSNEAARPRWTVRTSGARRFLVSPDGRSVDLTRSGPMVRVLETLAGAEEPRSPLEIFAAAWPDENVQVSSALHRVYTTIRRLRALGVPIVTAGNGYVADGLTFER